MTKEEQFKELMLDEEFKTWYDTRPEAVKELFQKYPFPRYKMAANAPYTVNTPGTIVEVRSFRENGEVTVVVTPENLQEDAKANIKDILESKSNAAQYEELISKPVMVAINPIFLEEIPDSNE